MALQPGLHASEQNTSLLIGLNVRRAGIRDMYLTDAQVAAAASIDDLITNIEAAVVHSQYEADKQQVIRALRFGKANGDFSNARVAAATSVEDLVDLTYAENAAEDKLGPHMAG